MASQTTATPDVQAELPATQVSLSRVGVTGVEKVIRVKADGVENLFYAGVEAQGMTACPCAQEAVAALARDRLAEDGFGAEEIERIIELVPVATHNQRGIGTLYVGCPEGGPAWIEAPELLRIVESSMSSE